MGARRLTTAGAAVLLACTSRFPGATSDASSEGGGVDGGGDAVVFPDAAPLQDGSPSSPSAVFAHSPDTLYRLDPTTKAVTAVGAFSGCSQVTDIALDRLSTMYGTTLDGLYRIDTSTAACTLVATGKYPNSLSFVPAGTLDPSVEALVGYVGDQYVRIDVGSGSMTTVGALGSGYSSSGDIVSVKGGGTFLTVKGGPNACSDCLVQVDPKSGGFLMEWGPLGRTDVFGIAFWGGRVYGFDNAGEVFQVDFSGLAMQITPIAIPSAPPSLQFFGAGSTTIAPLVQ